jgi:transcriptional regulator with XRE-family HTH domain
MSVNQNGTQSRRPQHARNIRDLRNAMGYTQRGLEELSGIPRRTISQIETGGNFSLQDVRAIANALDIGWQALAGLDL